MKPHLIFIILPTQNVAHTPSKHNSYAPFGTYVSKILRSCTANPKFVFCWGNCGEFSIGAFIWVRCNLFAYSLQQANWFCAN